MSEEAGQQESSAGADHVQGQPGNQEEQPLQEPGEVVVGLRRRVEVVEDSGPVLELYLEQVIHSPKLQKLDHDESH